MRYLNAVGGGTVLRIEDDMAYVDEDGFETPVLVRECVVVDSPKSFTPPSYGPQAKKPQPAPTKDVTPQKVQQAPTQLPVIETAGGDKLNVVLGFEASELRALSTSSFDAYLVNDSNYYLDVILCERDSKETDWRLLYHGTIEPNIQEFLCEIEPAKITHMERLLVQITAFKLDKAFVRKAPVDVELRVDTTKFAKLHCFRPNPYFDAPVIAFDIVSNDRAANQMKLNHESLAHNMFPAKDEAPRRAPKAASRTTGKDIIEVDLHASELFDSLDGLEPADILNFQIERFTSVMQQNLRKPGQKIVFIHGKGEGVLRQAIMKELTHRFKGHDVQDASFREYGFGATQVTIRKTDSAPESGNKKHRK